MYFWLVCWKVGEMLIRLGIIVLFSFVWAPVGKARAHPMLDRAVASYEEADFKSALQTFDAAARNADLSVEELLKLFEMRALVLHALGNEAAMRSDLRRLIAVRQSYQLGPLAPPPVRAAFEEVREANGGELGVELRIEEATVDGAPSITARVLRVPEGLVDHVTLQCGIDSNTKTISRTTQGISTSVKLSERGAHDGCTATARTRQGGVLFSSVIDGTHTWPKRGSTGVFEMPQYEPRADTSKKRKKKWPWIVAAAAVVVGGGIAAGVVLSQRSKSDGQPGVGGVTVNW